MVQGEKVRILDRNGKQVMEQMSDPRGTVSAELPEYSMGGPVKNVLSPYTLMTGKKKTEVPLHGNTEIRVIL
jgi:hypothetical protein